MLDHAIEGSSLNCFRNAEIRNLYALIIIEPSDARAWSPDHGPILERAKMRACVPSRNAARKWMDDKGGSHVKREG